MNELADAVCKVRIGPVTWIDDLAVVALLSSDNGPNVLFLEEALAEGRTEMSEVSADGMVNLVRLRHNGSAPLLLIDGEIIVGAKQDRLVNASFIVPAGADLNIPVSCVERGRWQANSSAFRAKGSTVSSTIRRTKLQSVSVSLCNDRSYVASQHHVWAGVSGFLSRSVVQSRTQSFSDGIDGGLPEIIRTIEKVPLFPDQVGVAIVVDGRFQTADLFGGPSLFRRAWRKIATGLFAEPRSKAPSAHADPTSIVRSALTAIADAGAELIRGPGSGTTLRAQTRAFRGLAVADNEILYHAFIASRFNESAESGRP